MHFAETAPPAAHGLQAPAEQGLQPFAAHGLQPLAAHGLHAFFAAHGLQPLAAQGLQAFFAAHGLHAFLALQAATWTAFGRGWAAGKAWRSFVGAAAKLMSASTMAPPAAIPTPTIIGMTVVASSFDLRELTSGSPPIVF